MKINFIEKKTYLPAPVAYATAPITGAPARGIRTVARDVGAPARGACTPAHGVHAPARGACAPARDVHAPARGVHAHAQGIVAHTRGVRSSARDLYPLKTVILANNLIKCHFDTPRLLHLNNGEGPLSRGECQNLEHRTWIKGNKKN
jgi:hypothetical protein